VAASKRGRKRGLGTHPRTVILIVAEPIVTETPPLSGGYGRSGPQVRVPITGSRAKRILHGALNINTGAVRLVMTAVWNEQTQQHFLPRVRSHWRGWRIVVFEDRGTPHTTEDTRAFAKDLHLALRFLPTATPKLNALDHLWRNGKGRALANRPTTTIDLSAYEACQHILKMSPNQRLQTAGVLSGNFWLTR
jgi:transposase